MSERRSICLNTLMGTEITGFSHVYARISLHRRLQNPSANAAIPSIESDITDDFLKSGCLPICSMGSCSEQ